jgi:5'-nucleotidase
MKFILTNDDGVAAPGLAALEQACRELGETVIVAPEQEHSGCGHRATTAQPIDVVATEPGRYVVCGTPVDCARIALTHLAPDADWLIAGINRGGNLGSDVYMSGTVAAAREAALLGYHGAAISQYVSRGVEVDWQRALSLARRVIRLLIGRGPCEGFFWNINLPCGSNGADPEVVFCGLDSRPHDVRYRREGWRFIYEGDYHHRQRMSGRDIDSCFGGRIAVTAIPIVF